MRFKDHLFELFLLEILTFLGLLYIDDYIGLMLCIFSSSICAIVLIIVLIAEWIEPSRVPKWYFWLIIITAIAPACSLLVYTLITKGNFDWLKGMM